MQYPPLIRMFNPPHNQLESKRLLGETVVDKRQWWESLSAHIDGENTRRIVRGVISHLS